MSVVYVHFAQLWYLSCEARDRSRVEEGRAHLGDDAIVAVVMAAAATEAFINETVALAVSRIATDADLQPDGVAAFAAVLGEAVETRVDVKAKYQLAASALRGRPFDKGRQPYQDFADLIRLRNWLVHLSPKRPGVVKRFEQQCLTLPRDSNETGETREVEISGVDLLSTAAIARWACEVSHRIIWAVLEMFPDGPADPVQIMRRMFVRAVRDEVSRELF